VMKVGTDGKCGEDTCTAFLQDVRVRKPMDVLVLDAANVEPLNDVAVGSAVFVFGYGAPTADQQSPKGREPLLRKTSVVGKSRELGLIMLDGAAYPGDSGGLVLRMDEGARGKGFKGIGVVSSAFHLERDNKDPRDYSVAVALDAVLELLGK